MPAKIKNIPSMNYHSHFKEMEMVSVGVRLRAGSRGSYPFDGNTFI